MAIGKRLRFEVFKRDAFTCQYCGRKAPDVILHLDHVMPRVDGGADDLLNLITSCIDCNLGKGRKPLSDETALDRQRRQLEELQERREQIEMMVEWQRSLLQLADDTLERAAEFWSEALDHHFSLNNVGREELQRLLNRYDLASVLEAMRIATSKYIRRDAEGVPTHDSVNQAWNKVGGICYNRRRWSEKPGEELADKAWWRDNAHEIARTAQSQDDARRFADQLIDFCLDEYYDGPHTSYWGALQALDGKIDISDFEISHRDA